MSPTIREMFDSISHRYDLLNRLLSLNRDKSWRKRAVSAVQHRDAPKVLDLCSGTLDMGIELLRQNNSAGVYAVDFSHKMLVRGRPKLNGLMESFSLSCADVMRLPFGEDIFDVVMCAFGMRNLPDLSRSLDEISRVMKEDGELIVLDFFRPVKPGVNVLSMLYEKTVIPVVGKIVSGDGHAYSYLPQSRIDFCDSHYFTLLMEDSGFGNISVTDMTLGIATMIRGTLS